jgi:hypothetical protein
MCSTGNGTRYKRQFVGAATAIIFLSASISASYANELSLGSYQQGGSVAPTGAAAMLQLRIPFGSDPTGWSRPTLSLSAGTTWRTEFGSQNFAGFRYTPGIEAGLAFGGDPVLRLGSIDVHKMFAQQWNADNAGSAGAEGSTFCGRNLALCIGGGVAIVAVAAVVVFGVWASNQHGGVGCESWC